MEVIFEKSKFINDSNKNHSNNQVRIMKIIYFLLLPFL